MDDGEVRCECGRVMRPMVGWRISVEDGQQAWRLWWECMTGDHVSCSVPIPAEGVSTIQNVTDHGSARLPHRTVAFPPEGSLHR